MLPKHHRLNLSAGQEPLRRLRRRAAGEHIRVRYDRNAEHINRYAVIVSKKAAPDAVRRNRIKRIVYETVRRRRTFLFQGGLDMVIYVQKSATNVSFEQALVNDLVFLLEKIVNEKAVNKK